MSLKHAILGFLSAKPMTGYDLKKAFDQSIQFFWPANQSQIYRTLSEATQEGLVLPELISREDRLDMKLYHLSDLGAEELKRWLSTPLIHQDYREAFLIQIYFGSRTDDAHVLALLKKKIDELQAAVDQLKAIYNLYKSNQVPQDQRRTVFFSMVTLEYGISSDQQALDWLKSVYQRLESGVYLPLDFENSNH